MSGRKTIREGVIINQIIHGDCLEIMPTLPDKSIDMVLCDLPYGTTACKWDTIIPFEPLWKEYKRLIKDNGAIVLTASQPFTSTLVCSNLSMFRYEWIWEKTVATNFMFVKKQPAKKHENVLVFYEKQPTYNACFEKGEAYTDKRLHRYKNKTGCVRESIMDIMKQGVKMPIKNNGTRYPSTIQKISNGNNKNVHPTQKPVALFEYLIKTYTNEGETVLDNCAGSGTTAIACLNTNRNYILIEKEKEYIDIINKRITEHEQQLTIGVIQ